MNVTFIFISPIHTIFVLLNHTLSHTRALKRDNFLSNYKKGGKINQGKQFIHVWAGLNNLYLILREIIELYISKIDAEILILKYS